MTRVVRTCLLLGAAFSAAIGGCSRPLPRAASPVRADADRGEQPVEHAGWYMEHGGRRTFLACGQSGAWAVAPSEALAARARAFGLDPDSPVYVRVRGRLAGGVLSVAEILQFGSPVPVRDCPLTGVVMPAQR